MEISRQANRRGTFFFKLSCHAREENEEVYDDSACDADDAKRDQMQIVVLLRCLVMVMNGDEEPTTIGPCS